MNPANFWHRLQYSKSCIRKLGTFSAHFPEAEKAIGDAHEASGPYECERRLKRVYTDITQYVCGGFCGGKQCKGDELAMLAEGQKKQKMPGNVVSTKSCESCLFLRCLTNHLNSSDYMKDNDQKHHQ